MHGTSNVFVNGNRLQPRTHDASCIAYFKIVNNPFLVFLEINFSRDFILLDELCLYICNKVKNQ